MVTFRQAVQSMPQVGFTNNGMATLTTSGNPCVDLYFAIGASRGKDLTQLFERSYTKDALLTRRMLFWARDARGGAGERDTFRKLLAHLATTRPSEVVDLIRHVPFFGRWDDLLVFLDHQDETIRHELVRVIQYGLEHPNMSGLAAKWLPRKGVEAAKLRRLLGMNPKQYRTLLVSKSKTVEQLMCAKRWDEIMFDHVPSVAAARYQKAFNKRCAERYKAYKEGLKKGERTIKASAVYPYDVIKSIKLGDPEVAKAQWEALPNYFGENIGFMLPLVDVSSSMDCSVGGNPNVTCMDMSIALGLYLSDKQQGPFKDCWLNFSTKPVMKVLEGDVIQKYKRLANDGDWEGSTNLAAAIREILRMAIVNKVAADQMPKWLVVLSDMEFDKADRQSFSGRWGSVQAGRSSDNLHLAGNPRAIEVLRAEFSAHGYSVPKIVFWNLNARPGNNPVQAKDENTVLVSGYSPSLLRSILSAKQVTPEDVMMEALNNERYLIIT